MDIFIWLIVIAAIVGLLIWLFSSRSSSPSPPQVSPQEHSNQIQQVLVAQKELAAARQSVERERQSLQRTIDAGLQRLQFQSLRQLHFESMKVGDAWYNHKRQAIAARKSASAGLSSLKSHKVLLAQKRDRSRGQQRQSLVGEISVTQSSIDAHYAAIGTLNSEIDRGVQLLTRYNMQTGSIRDHIRDSCGEQGRKWHRDLMQRTEKRRTQNR